MSARAPDLLPRPRALQVRDGTLRVNGPLAVRGAGAWNALAVAMADAGTEAFRRRAGFAAAAAPTVPCTVQVGTALDGPAAFGVEVDEGFRITIDPDGIAIAAASTLGVAHAFATLVQWLDSDRDGWHLRCTVIDDAPAWPWRGLMLDPARRFLPLPDLLRTVEAMWAAHLNVLHLHLSDDQGWRLESSSCPELHRIGGADGWYRRTEVEALVRHAAARGIRVVAEIDLPGHASALLAARPDLAATAAPAAPSRAFGVHAAALDPGAPALWPFLDGLLAELAGLFPDPCLHIGGDEVHPDAWPDVAGAEHADARRRRQAAFTARLAALLARHGRRAVAWDEVLHPDVPADVIVQAWRGVHARERALAAGHATVLSAPYYLDLGWTAADHAALDAGAPAAAWLAHEDAVAAGGRMAPVAAGLRWWNAHTRRPPLPPARGGGRLLGAEACMWAEVLGPQQLDTRLWLRLPVLADAWWHGVPSHRDTDPDGPGAADPAARERALDRFLAVLAALGAADPHAELDRALLRAGAGHADLPALRALAGALEPLPWYGRLLGAERLAARARGEPETAARPYAADTALNRLVDALPVDSRACAAAERACAAARQGDPAALAGLRAQALAWLDGVVVARRLGANHHVFAEVLPVVDAVERAARTLLDGADALQHTPGAPLASAAPLPEPGEVPAGEIVVAAWRVVRALAAPQP